jgi:hypothetical protein
VLPGTDQLGQRNITTPGGKRQSGKVKNGGLLDDKYKMNLVWEESAKIIDLSNSSGLKAAFLRGYGTA